MLVRRQDHWIIATVGDEIVMMCERSEKYIGLNKVGARIWSLIETPRTVDDICELLIRRFKVAPEICRSEVQSFLQELEQNGAVVLAPSPAA